jgi:hypothetical protein
LKKMAGLPVTISSILSDEPVVRRKRNRDTFEEEVEEVGATIQQLQIASTPQMPQPVALLIDEVNPAFSSFQIHSYYSTGVAENPFQGMLSNLNNEQQQIIDEKDNLDLEFITFDASIFYEHPSQEEVAVNVNDEQYDSSVTTYFNWDSFVMDLEVLSA